MTFNSCKECGSINERATIALNKLKKKMDERSYLLKYGNPEERLHREPEGDIVWVWTEELKKVLADL